MTIRHPIQSTCFEGGSERPRSVVGADWVALPKSKARLPELLNCQQLNALAQI
jgi:hypothetical protein